MMSSKASSQYIANRDRVQLRNWISIMLKIWYEATTVELFEKFSKSAILEAR